VAIFKRQTDTMKNLTVILMTILISCSGHIMTQQDKDDFIKREKKCEDAVTSWIKKNAVYPDSYMSLGFKEYSEGSKLNGDEKIPNSERYSIFHTHKIKDINGETVTFSVYFKLEHDYFVDIIEIENSNSIGGAYPPETEIWLDKFGRPMTTKDSTELNERQLQYANKTLNELKNMKYESESDKEKVMKMLDTADKK
jgi:hypothetical protein